VLRCLLVRNIVVKLIIRHPIQPSTIGHQQYTLPPYLVESGEKHFGPSIVKRDLRGY